MTRRTLRIFLCCAVVLAAALGARAQRPRFEPQRDYAYDLAATDAAVAEVVLDTGGFAWPELPPGDTVLLEVTVIATGPDAPKLSAARGTAQVHQVFEENSRGRRFLDVSPLRLGAGGRVMLAAEGMAWVEGPARLFVYRNTPLAGRRVLVLAPHPDDAEIAAFGVYRRTKADVVTVTAGDAGGANFEALWSEPGEHFRVKGWIRTWDSISVPFYGGVFPGQARNLGYYDAMLRPMQADPAKAFAPLKAKLDEPGYYRKFNVDPALRDRPFASTWDNLVADLVWELERVRPQVIVAPHPMLDNHADHQFTTIALIDALERWPGDCELLLYTNHGLENEAFPLGGRDAMTGLPAWSGRELFFRRVYSHALTPEEQRLKLVALEAMHDLREFDLRENAPPILTALAQRTREQHDYFRRGPRPNELFFVVTRTDAKRLREAFLAARQASDRQP
ncbi:MAG TPA: PIG-L family deacetylase [Opitutaceae bacterium]|nr:PIG-L family deacetylase [Opitutaceae bacterium]